MLRRSVRALAPRVAQTRNLVKPLAAPRRNLACAAVNEDDFDPPYEHRLTKLVSTIGPASEQFEPLQGCVHAGMDVMRVNFSHATDEEFHLRRTNLRAAEGGEYVAVMLDTKGPEIRMGRLRVCVESDNRKAKMSLVAGEALSLTTDPAFDGKSDETTLYIDYPQLGEVLKEGDTVLLDDGLVSLRVTGPASGGVVPTEVLNSSDIGERKGVNLPGVKTGLPAMSDKDKRTSRWASSTTSIWWRRASCAAPRACTRSARTCRSASTPCAPSAPPRARPPAPRTTRRRPGTPTRRWAARRTAG